MPIIEFTAGKMTREVKDKLIAQLTDISVEITGIPKHLFFVTINEKPDEDIAVGGVSVQKIKEELSKPNSRK
jgi:4-oxalocrotonate tautomerase